MQEQWVINITETPCSESTVSAHLKLKRQQKNAYWGYDIQHFFTGQFAAGCETKEDKSNNYVGVAKQPTAYITDNEDKRWTSRWSY